ncbi:MAG: MBL fold metallo-hydrolase [Methanoregula sp.]|jgi:glyoxylase-like metal-dependent hydrolase (beta-lactamase superfamily II)
MKILNLFTKGTQYTSNVYLVTGTWNTLNDVNTLIDTGRDTAILPGLMAASTGLGKKRIEQVVLTHSHYDHVTLLPLICDMFSPTVLAASPFLEGVDVILKGGETVRLGDRDFEIIYTPGHSNDSICLYCSQDGVLFSGDTPLVIHTTDGTYEPEFICALETLCSRDIRSIYFGHGPPLFDRCNEILKESLRNVRKNT